MYYQVSWHCLVKGHQFNNLKTGARVNLVQGHQFNRHSWSIWYRVINNKYFNEGDDYSLVSQMLIPECHSKTLVKRVQLTSMLTTLG